MLSDAASRGDADAFHKGLVAALRQGPLDADTAEWLAQFVENGGVDNLKFKVTRARAGKPIKRIPPWRMSRHENDGRYLAFRLIADESKSKEDAFDRARTELKVGKKIAEEFWKLRKRDEEIEAADPYRAERFQEFKRQRLLERAERGI